MQTLASVSIRTRWGEKTISVLCGDLRELQQPLDVMTISAFRGNYAPLPQTLCGALASCGVSVARFAEAPEMDLRSFCDVWLSRQIHNCTLPIGRIGCIELLPLTDRGQALPSRDVLSLIRSYFLMLELAAASGAVIRTVGMPLLGTGMQQIAAELIVTPVLNECLQYLNRCETAQSVVFIERNPDKAQMLADKLAASYSLARSKDLSDKAESSSEKPLAFISYSHNDKNVADNLCAKLEAAGIRVWYAPRDVDAPDYATAVTNAIGRCTHFIVLLSQNSLHSEHVLNEVDLAFQELERKVRFYPLKLDQETLGAAFRYYLSRQHWMDATLPPLEARLEEFVQKIVSEL